MSSTTAGGCLRSTPSLKAPTRNAAHAVAICISILLAGCSRGVARQGPWLASLTREDAEACWRDDGKYECKTIERGDSQTLRYTVPISTHAYEGRWLPEPKQPLRFAVIGDMGKATAAQAKVARALAKFDPHFVLVTGDIVYPGGSERDYDLKYFPFYSELTAKAPFYPAVGNHDYGNAIFLKGRGQRRFERVYASIHRKPKYYSFSTGTAEFFSIDDNEYYGIEAAAPFGADSAQRRWLAERLKASAARWKIVFAHVPIYSTVLHAEHARLRRDLEPLLIENGVALFLAGHDHLYERSKPRGGVLHLTAGTGGAPLHRPKVADPDWLAKRFARHGFIGATMSVDGLALEFITEDGETLDAVQLK